MTDKDKSPEQNGGARLTRRAVIGGLVAATVVPSIAGQAFGAATSGFQTAAAVSPPTDPFPRSGHTASYIGSGKILVAGGDSGYGILSDCQIFNTYDGTWRDAAPMNTQRRNHAAAAMPNGQILVFGGENMGLMSEVELYDPPTNTWTVMNPMQIPRAGHQATWFATNKFLISGGTFEGILGSPEYYILGAPVF